MSDNKYAVFLSYSAEDKEWVSEFHEALREAGKKAWYDVEDLKPGDRWQEKIQEALRESETLIVIVSRKTLNSKWVFFELGAAVAGGKKIIPVVTGDVDYKDIHPSLTRFQFLREDSASEAGKAVARILSEQEHDDP